MVRWVETRTGDLAVIVRDTARGLLIRYATPRGGYHTVGHDWVTRRPDCDAWPEPAWLQQARRSPHPPRLLWALLHDDDPGDPWRPPAPMFEDADDPRSGDVCHGDRPDARGTGNAGADAGGAAGDDRSGDPE